jgi:tetratricopeptide (TPR) repeat protein
MEVPKIVSWGQAAAMTVCGIVGAIATGGEPTTAVIVGSSLNVLSAALIAKLVTRTDRHDDKCEALASALHNEHLAKIAADAVTHVILARQDILESGPRKKLAEAAGLYWLKLLRQEDGRVAGYVESELPARLTEYLEAEQQGQPILLPQWKQILMESAADAGLSPDLSDAEWNQLAGHMCREYPRQLYTTIKTNLQSDGAAFAGVVIRMLAEISHSVSELRGVPPPNIDLTPLFENFASLTSTVLSQTQTILVQLDASARLGREQLIGFRDEMRTALASVKDDTAATRQMVEQLTTTNAQQAAALAGFGSEMRQLLQQLVASNQQAPSQYAGLVKAVVRLPNVLGEIPAQEGKRDEPERIAAAYERLEREENLPQGTLERELPGFAQWLLHRPDLDSLAAVQARFVQRQYDIAEAGALDAERSLAQQETELYSRRIMAFCMAGHAAREQFCYTRALEHYRAAAALAVEKNAPYAWAGVQTHIAHTLIDLGKGYEAELALRPVLRISESVQGEEDPITLQIRNDLAVAMEKQGKYPEAEAEHRQVLAISERVLSAEHPGTLASRNNLAATLDLQGKHAEAEAEFRAILPIIGRVRGRESPSTLTTRVNLANALDAQGKYAEAESEFRAVLMIQERLLGSDNTQTMDRRKRLANWLLQQCKYTEAEAEFRRLLVSQERVNGAEHPDTLITRSNIAAAMLEQGNSSGAEAELRAVLPKIEQVLPAEDRNALSSRNNLAVALYSQGKYAEAEAELRTMLSIRERVLGAEHLDTLENRKHLAMALGKQGKDAEEDQEYRRVIDIFASQNEQGRALLELGNTGDAQKHYHALLQNMARILGVTHPETMMTRANLASTLAEQGKFAEAEVEFRTVLPIAERMRAADPEAYHTIAYSLAACIAKQGKLKEALGMMQRTEAQCIGDLGPEHPSTKAAKAAREKIEAKLDATRKQ